MKKAIIPILTAALCLAATACSMNSGSGVLVSPMPTAMTTSGPRTGGADTPDPIGPGGADGAAMTAAMTAAQSAALSDKANAAAAQVSEIDGCVTAIVGNACLAGVTFDKQYQGEMTERIRDMVGARIQSVAPEVERVAVTHDPELVSEIGTLAERIRGAKDMGEVAQSFDSVMEKMK